jgi:hypothetical protein
LLKIIKKSFILCNGNSNGVSSEGSSFLATNIHPLDPNGFLQITTLTTTATVQLPYPALKKSES